MVRRLGPVAFASAVLVLVLAPGAGATVRIRGVSVSAFPQVGVTVSTDSASELSRDDVQVRENGILVAVSRVTSLNPSTQHVDAVLAIDVSNSMAGDDLRTALAAAKEFVARVPDSLPVGIVAFASAARVVSPITSDRVSVAAAVDGIATTTTQGTALYEAIESATRLFSGGGQHNLIVLTDGRNTVATATLTDSVSAATDAHVAVFTLGLDGPDTDELSLRQIAQQTNGAYRSLSATDLDAAYRSLAEQLGQQFVIAYRSKVPYGMPATITVTLPDGTARTKVLMPAHERVAPTKAEDLSSRLFQGDLGLALAVALTFLAVLGLTTLIGNIGRDERRRRSLEDRLLAPRRGEARGSPGGKGGATMVPRPIADAVERGADAAGASRPLAAMLVRAGWSLSIGEFLVPSVLLPLVLAGFATVAKGPIVGGAAAVAFLPIPFVILSMAGRKRVNQIQGQLPDVLMILASSLRAGHSFLQALDSVAKEIDEPAASEFARTLSEVRLGRNMDDALNALAVRVGGQDLEWAVTAINIQRKVGGNLAEVLETVANTIRERQTIRRQVKVLSAEGRLSVTILFVLPFLIALYLAIVNPDYLSALTGTVPGIAMLMVAIVLMLVGLLWMRKVVRLDV